MKSEARSNWNGVLGVVVVALIAAKCLWSPSHEGDGQQVRREVSRQEIDKPAVIAEPEPRSEPESEPEASVREQPELIVEPEPQAKTCLLYTSDAADE